MRIIKWLASSVITCIIAFVGVYFVVSLCIGYFKLSGRLIEGQDMYFDMQTPTWAGLLVFQVICVAIIAVGEFLRGKLR